jgi:hypothetical protein
MQLRLLGISKWKLAMRTLDIGDETVCVEITEFEMMALAALVERGQEDVSLGGGDVACIGTAINAVATEFRSLLGHFDLSSTTLNGAR